MVIRQIPSQSMEPVQFTDMSNIPRKGWVLIELKTLGELMLENDYFFDTCGNFCTAAGHIAPAHFCHLGQQFHVKDGCGFTQSDCAWLRKR